MLHCLPVLRSTVSLTAHSWMRRSVSPLRNSWTSFTATRMYSQRPTWLESALQDKASPPRLYAWGPSNIGLQDRPKSHVTDDPDHRIFVLGIGNLGRLFATSLAQSPNRPPITLVVHRRELLEQWESSQGIEILRAGVLEANKDFDIEWWTDSRPETGSVREISDGGSIKNLVITTKASAALPQVDRVRRYLDQTSTIAFVQNGMSKLWPPHGPAYVSHRFALGSAPNFLACVTAHGVTSQGQFKSFHASQADVAIGAVLPNQSSIEPPNFLISQVVSAPHLDGRQVSRPELWILQLEKLVINAILNPLTAILGCQNGDIFTEPDGVLGKIIDQLLDEASQVLQLLVAHESSAEIIEGSAAIRPEQIALDTTPLCLHDRFSQPRLKEMIYHVGHKVRENTSSMLQDVRASRSTEIRDFNGWLVETAALLDPSLDTTGHCKLIDLVEAGKTLHVDQLGTHFDS